jgi:serum/glucocorticoid-regulated kinase 2
MSWRVLGKKKSALLAAADGDRSSTPTPGSVGSRAEVPSGILTIRVMWAEGLSLPAGTSMPPSVEAALKSQQAKAASSVSPSSVVENRLSHKRTNGGDSIQRKQCWWLPYLLMEYEINQILITPLGGDLDKPIYMYQAHFDVSRDSDISMQFYLRKDEPKHGSDGPADDMGNDLFLGSVTFKPDFGNFGNEGLCCYFDTSAG